MCLAISPTTLALCGSCSSGRGFASGFHRIPPRDGHPCHRLRASRCRARRGLSPLGCVPCPAHCESPQGGFRTTPGACHRKELRPRPKPQFSHPNETTCLPCLVVRTCPILSRAVLNKRTLWVRLSTPNVLTLARGQLEQTPCKAAWHCARDCARVAGPLAYNSVPLGDRVGAQMPLRYAGIEHLDC